MGDDGSILII